MSDSDTLAAIVGEFGQDFVDNIVARSKISCYAEFLVHLYGHLDAAIQRLQQSRHVRHQDSEDHITEDLVLILRERGFDAQHDASHNGNVDLKVTRDHYPSEFVWLGEAKIFTSPSAAWEGYLQLSTRYADEGGDNQQGGILLYLRDRLVRDVMPVWGEKLTEKIPEEFDSLVRLWACPDKPTAFFSSHAHPDTGEPFTVRHMPVNLNFRPRDRSGRNTRASAG